MKQQAKFRFYSPGVRFNVDELLSEFQEAFLSILMQCRFM
jgi:hypothetical protein